MGHPSHDALVRYLAKESDRAERAGVEWHLTHCPVCSADITAMDIVRAARQVRLRGGPRRKARKNVVQVEHLSRELIMRWLSRSCSPEERRTVESHLQFCRPCKRQYTIAALVAMATECHASRSAAAGAPTAF